MNKYINNEYSYFNNRKHFPPDFPLKYFWYCIKMSQPHGCVSAISSLCALSSRCSLSSLQDSGAIILGLKHTNDASYGFSKSPDAWSRPLNVLVGWH